MTEFRTWTPDERTESGHIVRVKRACNGCGFLIGDVAEAEVRAGVVGTPLPDVQPECPTCNRDLWPAALVTIAELRHEVFTLTNSEDARVLIVEQERDNALLEVERLRAELAAERRDHGLTAETLNAFAAEHRREWGAC